MDIVLAVEELAISGKISLGRRSLSTVYRWKRAISDYLSREGYEWTVELNKNDKILYRVDNY